MTPLESRKRLLIAESELNRAQLGLDWCVITTEVRTLTNRTRSFAAIASSAVALVSGLTAWCRGKSADAGGKSPWLPTILKGAGLISTLWSAFRPPDGDHKNK